MKYYIKNLTTEQKKYVSFSKAVKHKEEFDRPEISESYYIAHNALPLKKAHDLGLRNNHAKNFKLTVLSGYFAEIAAFKYYKNKYGLQPADITNSKYCDFQGERSYDFQMDGLDLVSHNPVFIEVKTADSEDFVNINIAKLRQYISFLRGKVAKCERKAEIGGIPHPEKTNFYYLFCVAVPRLDCANPHYVLRPFGLDEDNIAKLESLPVQRCTQPLNPMFHDINSSGFVTVDLQEMRAGRAISYL